MDLHPMLHPIESMKQSLPARPDWFCGQVVFVSIPEGGWNALNLREGMAPNGSRFRGNRYR